MCDGSSSNTVKVALAVNAHAFERDAIHSLQLAFAIQAAEATKAVRAAMRVHPQLLHDVARFEHQQLQLIVVRESLSPHPRLNAAQLSNTELRRVDATISIAHQKLFLQRPHKNCTFSSHLRRLRLRKEQKNHAHSESIIVVLNPIAAH